MAKKAKKSTISLILSIVSLLLAVLLICTFFMPTYTVGEGEDSYTLTAIEMLEANGMTEEEAVTAGLNSANMLKSEEERLENLKLSTAYTYLNDEDNSSIKTSMVFNVIVLVVGVISLVASILSLINIGPAIVAVIAHVLSTIASVVLLITSLNAVAYVEGTLLPTLATGAGVWIAVVAAVLMLVCGVAGMFFKTSKKRKK